MAARPGELRHGRRLPCRGRPEAVIDGEHEQPAPGTGARPILGDQQQGETVGPAGNRQGQVRARRQGSQRRQAPGARALRSRSHPEGRARPGS